jgi:arylsulfatase A-like enzyme
MYGFSTGAVLEQIAAGKAPQAVLALIPLMIDGGEPGIIRRWLEVAQPALSTLQAPPSNQENPMIKPSLLLPHLLAALFLAPPAKLSAASPDRPNVLLVVADDMGFSDAGCYGGEIATPNLNTLAKNGLRFTQFYNTARCWPSRAAILTGYYAQQVRRDTVPGVKSGGQGVRPAWAALLPEMLRPLGYRSYHSGKWHVDGKPLENGFDRSYSLEDHDRHFTPRRHTEDDRPLPPVGPKAGYYSTTAIANHAIKYLKEHAEKNAKQPFFAFVAFTSPHFPLQAPAEDVARYRTKYLAGWDALRQQRWQRMKEMKIGGSALAPIERDVGPPYDFPGDLRKLGPNELNRPLPWSELTVPQREFQAAKMAVHGAMVDRMDREIGRVLAQVKEMGELDNTLVLFLSDNGASAEIMVRGDGHDPEAHCGTGATFLCIGPGWSSLANTPFRRHKTWVHEGGISTPLIVHWPRGIDAHGELRHTPGHVIDLAPTILELAGGKWPLVRKGKPVPPAPGKRLVSVFAKDETVKRNSIWWLHEGNRALRVGDWKIVAAGKASPWELYDLSADRSETKDLAKARPDKVRELAAVWAKQFEEYAALARKDLPKGGEALKPIKVFILAGQSNMEGHGLIKADPKRNGGKGSLEYLVKDAARASRFKHLVDRDGKWAVRDDVWIHYLDRKGRLTVGFGANEERIGPELGFGQVVGDAIDEPVLLIKLAWGGKSLAKDFRPPSSGGEVGPYYTQIVNRTRNVLGELHKKSPSFKGRGYQIAGFGWHQGWNDRINPSYTDEYEKNLANFIRDLRKDLGVKNLPFVIAETGMGGPGEKDRRALALMKAQAAVTEYKEFRENVAFVETRAFWRPRELSPTGQGYHWNTNAETYYLIGEAMGKAMKKLCRIK